MLPILLIDESDELRNILKFPLIYAGFEVLEAHDALEAVGLLVHHQVALIITDWEMPQMNGIDFVRKLRETPTMMHLPVLMLLKEHEAYKKAEAKFAGVTDTIIRPTELHRLVEKVKKYLGE